jgi:Holliday junction resolvase RusA-like endonuclease
VSEPARIEVPLGVGTPRAVSFVVHGVPVAKGRPKLTTRGGFAHAYTPAKTRAAEATITARAIQFRPPEPFACGLHVRLTFVFPVPDSWSRKKRAAALTNNMAHTTKPDIDNLVKATLDALCGPFFLDDKQIASLHAVKVYGPTPMTEVSIVATFSGATQ